MCPETTSWLYCFLFSLSLVPYRLSLLGPEIRRNRVFGATIQDQRIAAYTCDGLWNNQLYALWNHTENEASKTPEAAKDGDDIFVTCVERRKFNNTIRQEFLVLYVKQHGYSRRTVILMRKEPRRLGDISLCFSRNGTDNFQSSGWVPDSYDKLATLRVTGAHFSVSQFIVLADAVGFCDQKKGPNWFAQTTYSIIKACFPADATQETKHRGYIELQPESIDAVKAEFENRWKAYKPIIHANRLDRIQELESMVKQKEEAAMLKSRETTRQGISSWRTHRLEMKILRRCIEDEKVWLALADARSAGTLKTPRRTLMWPFSKPCSHSSPQTIV